MRSKLNVDWSKKFKKTDLGPALTKYRRYLVDLGFRESSIKMYVFRVAKYLEFAKTDQPLEEDHLKFRDYLQDKKLARNTMNHYGFSVKKYHEMIGRPTTFNFMTPNDNIPYYFTEDDINRIFAVIPNVKHNCMLMVMFYGCLRASELCGLDDKDIDFETRSIKIRAGKGGRDAIVPLKPEVAQVIRDYLEIRPSIKIGDEHPLFITDYKNRWSKETLHVMFKKYKKLAKITKPGGLHVFGRHSPASIMIKNGCDIMTIKEIMRHKDIKTTARYLHISDQTKRLKYEQFLVL